MTPEQIVRTFFENVRSGRNLDYANRLMAAQVLAHQVISEEEVTVTRTPLHVCGPCEGNDRSLRGVFTRNSGVAHAR